MYGSGFSASFQHFSRLALREAIVFSSGSNFSVIILLQFLVVHWFNIHTYKNLPLSARHFLILMKEGWQNRPLFRHPSHDWKLPVHWLGYDWKWSAFFMSEALLYDKVYSLSPSYISPKPYHWRNKYSHEGCLRSEYGQRRPSYFFLLPPNRVFASPKRPEPDTWNEKGWRMIPESLKNAVKIILPPNKWWSIITSH